MPYCPNCGNTVKDTYRYCGQCGQPLSDEVEDDEGIPPSSHSHELDGFLSGRSLEYILDVQEGNTDWDTESIGYAHLRRDLGHALADFQWVSNVQEANLFELVLDFVGEGSLHTDVEKMNHSEQQRFLAWLGLFNLPGLYDDAFGMDWREELQDRVNEVMNEIQSEID